MKRHIIIEPVNYNPEISLEEIMAFEPEKPETHTRSGFINTVCRSFAVNGYQCAQEMAKSLGMTTKAFNTIFETLTGTPFVEARAVLAADKARKLRHEHPYWSTEHLAKALGFNNRATLWALISKENYAELHNGTLNHIIKEKMQELRQQLEREIYEQD